MCTCDRRVAGDILATESRLRERRVVTPSASCFTGLPPGAATGRLVLPSALLMACHLAPHIIVMRLEGILKRLPSRGIVFIPKLLPEHLAPREVFPENPQGA